MGGDKARTGQSAGLFAEGGYAMGSQGKDGYGFYKVGGRSTQFWMGCLQSTGLLASLRKRATIMFLI